MIRLPLINVEVKHFRCMHTLCAFQRIPYPRADTHGYHKHLAQSLWRKLESRTNRASASIVRGSGSRRVQTWSEDEPVLPLQHSAFFTAGMKLRVPMYLATSFDEDVAYRSVLLLAQCAC